MATFEMKYFGIILKLFQCFIDIHLYSHVNVAADNKKEINTPKKQISKRMHTNTREVK